MNLFSVKNKVALVTGASRGLGRAIAIGLAQAGATVICSSSRKGGTDQTLKAIKKLGGKGSYLKTLKQGSVFEKSTSLNKLTVRSMHINPLL